MLVTFRLYIQSVVYCCHLYTWVLWQFFGPIILLLKHDQTCHCKNFRQIQISALFYNLPLSYLPSSAEDEWTQESYRTDGPLVSSAHLS